VNLTLFAKSLFASKKLLNMKKWVVILVIGLILSLPYIFIPSIIRVQQSVIVTNNLRGFHRSLSEHKNWIKWWPGSVADNEKTLLLNGNPYRITDFTPSTVDVDVEISSVSNRATLLFIPLGSDSIKLEWDMSISTTSNPLKRLQLYFASSTIANDIHAVLTSIQSYYANTERTYGLDIRRESVKDSSLVFTLDSSKGYPSTEKIYSMIDQLSKYIDSHSAIATDAPMLNVYTVDKINYVIKAAVPTSKILPSNGKINYRWMLPHGNILVAEVRGDRAKVDSAFNIMENYIADYDLASPAIPYYSLITNRLKEKDSTRWITKIYYPVMYYKN